MGEYFFQPVHEQIFNTFQLPQLLYFFNVDHVHTNLPRLMHKHEHLELVFVKDGTGSQQIGHKKYQTKKGDLLIYNPNIVHDENFNNTNLSVFCLGIQNLQLKKLLQNCLIDDQYNTYVFATGARYHEFFDLFTMIDQQTQHMTKTSHELCNNLMRSLLLMTLAVIQEQQFTNEKDDLHMLFEIKDYLDKHYSEELKIEYLAQQFHISPSYLSHAYKACYSPMQYVLRRRIGEAQSLLINTEESITKIALSVGYGNVNYFTTLFSKLVGMSPIKYRKLWQH